PVRHRGHDDLGLDRVRGGDLPGRAPGRAVRPDRGRGHRRGRAVAHVPQGDAPAAQPGLAVPGRLAHDQRAAVVRRGLPEHPGRPAARHHGAGLLPLLPGLPELQLRLRLGHRLLPVRRHHRDHRDPVPGRPAVHVLPLMTATTLVRSRSRWRRLPFSPWHLVLVPATLVLAFPFIWLVLTSLETPSEALHFPPLLTPHVLKLSNYPAAWHSAPFGRFF